jgi:hypothetical protein
MARPRLHSKLPPRAIAPRRDGIHHGDDPTLLGRLEPGLVTGASDDDPSGIATHSQVGAYFGYGLLWTMLFTYPSMAAIQEISARMIGLAIWDESTTQLC